MRSSLAILLLVSACGGTAGCGRFGRTTALPTDAALAQDFSSKQEDFARLAHLAVADSNLWRIAPGSAWVRGGRGEPPRIATAQELPPERAEEYRKLFAALGLKSGLIRENIAGGEAILFPAAVRGVGTVDSEEKGYAFVAGGEPSPLVSSLDQIRVEVKKPLPAFKKVRGMWYLYWRYNE